MRRIKELECILFINLGLLTFTCQSIHMTIFCVISIAKILKRLIKTTKHVPAANTIIDTIMLKMDFSMICTACSGWYDIFNTVNENSFCDVILSYGLYFLC